MSAVQLHEKRRCRIAAEVHEPDDGGDEEEDDDEARKERGSHTWNDVWDRAAAMSEDDKKSPGTPQQTTPVSGAESTFSQ